MDVILSLESHMLTHSEYWSINNQRAKEFGKKYSLNIIWFKTLFYTIERGPVLELFTFA